MVRQILFYTGLITKDDPCEVSYLTIRLRLKKDCVCLGKPQDFFLQ